MHDSIDRIDAMTFQKKVIYFFDLQGSKFIDDQLTVNIIVSDGNAAAAVKITGLAPTDAAHRKAFGNLVFFQLGEHRQDADHRTAEGGRGIKIFIDGYKIDATI
ncbi:hypothetical protein SDC9_141691 [bioreactor metagenome]|uniref:Uncharacterized protein n=1 Tax=bioreactor metagenome TaxID=1076179 RepID=A0A645DYZ3_9ZZZZ